MENEAIRVPERFIETEEIHCAIPKIKNGSQISIGKLRTLTILVDHHFNWFQKKMMHWCFGFKVTDYTEE